MQLSEFLTPTNISTAGMRADLMMASDIEAFIAKNRRYFIKGRLRDHLDTLLQEKNLQIADVERDSGLSHSYIYQIFSGDKNPSRDKLLALAFGLHLTADETQKLLKVSGNRELYVKDERDAIILFSLQHGKTIWEANDTLYNHGFETLGSR